VRRLVDKGYSVSGLSRSFRNAKWLGENGAESRSGDILDEESMLEAVSGCDAVLHLATVIPTKVRTSLKDGILTTGARTEK
jgi:nucleoside-diphosphate-sugar epimerase